ncbi:hypothetical protein Tco_0901343 [Tanacetum coccineum]
MPPRRTRNINDVYERIMARMDERLDQFVDQFSNRMNDMMNLRRCGDRNGRRSEDEELGNPFFEGDCSSSNEWGDHGVAGDDYEGAPVFDDGYEEAPIFDDDQFEEESMPVYDTDIEDVIGEEEENMEDIVVVANDLCSSMIQTTLSVDFSKNINSNPHELIWSQKGNLVEASDYDNSGLAPELQHVSPSADTTSPSQQELDLLFGPLYDEFFTTAAIQVDNAHVDDNEFYNVFSTPLREEAESSPRYVDPSNMHIFYQPYQSEYRWTKDHTLSQVRRNPSKLVQTR